MNAVTYLLLAFFLTSQVLVLVFCFKQAQWHNAEHKRMFGHRPDAAQPPILRSSREDLDRWAFNASHHRKDGFISIPAASFLMVLDDARTAHALAARTAPLAPNAPAARLVPQTGEVSHA